MKLEKIEYQKLQIGSVIQAKKDGKVYYVDGLLPKITIAENGNPNNCKGLTISTLTRYYQLVVPEAVGEQPVEPEVEPVEPVEPEEVAPVEVQVQVTENQVQAIPVTTISTEPKTVKIQISSEPKKKGGKQKLSDEQYLAMVEDYLKNTSLKKKEICNKYGVHPSILSDALSDKYCRTSCKSKIDELKKEYGYSK